MHLLIYVHTYKKDRQKVVSQQTDRSLISIVLEASGSKEHLGNYKEHRVWGRDVVEPATVRRGLPAMLKSGAISVPWGPAGEYPQFPVTELSGCCYAASGEKAELIGINLEKRSQQARNVPPLCEYPQIQRKDLRDNGGISFFPTVVIRVPQDQAQNLISAGPKQPRAPVSITS